MDLFRSEVESHSETLSNALMQLERDPSDTSVYDSMMRSAHSIKGAARIVRVDAAVELSHVMEDCFVAARRGELQIKPQDFDVLLQAVDLLARISDATRDSETSPESLGDEVRVCVDQLKSVRGITVAESDVPPIRGNPDPAGSDTVSVVKAVRQTPAEFAQQTAPTTASESQAAEKQPARQQPREIVLTAGSSLFQSDAEVLRQQLLHELKSGVSSIRVDMAATRNIDPTGLAFLASALQHVRATGASLTFSPISDEMKVVLRLTGLIRT